MYSVPSDKRALGTAVERCRLEGGVASKLENSKRQNAWDHHDRLAINYSALGQRQEKEATDVISALTYMYSVASLYTQHLPL